MSNEDEQPPPPEQAPPPGIEPVPPAQQAVPPGVQPVPPAQQPVPPAQQPVPPAQQPVPPAQQPVPPGVEPVPPAGGVPQHPAQADPYQQQAPVPGPPPPTFSPPPAAGATPPSHQPARSQGGRRRGAKKKMVRKTASRGRPGATRPGTRYRRQVQPVDSGISVMSILMAIVGLILLSVSLMALLPRDLSFIDGYPADPMSNKEPRNLLARGQKILETREEDAVFSEKEVNDYLNFRLQGKQNGALKSMMQVRGIYVDLRPKEAEIFVERSFPLLGSVTMSTVVRSHFNSIKHEQVWKTGGGSIGRIRLKEKSLQPVLNAFLRLSSVAEEEIEVMNYMADIKLEEDKITLDSSL